MLFTLIVTVFNFIAIFVIICTLRRAKKFNKIVTKSNVLKDKFKR